MGWMKNSLLFQTLSGKFWLLFFFHFLKAKLYTCKFCNVTHKSIIKESQAEQLSVDSLVFFKT